MQRIPEPELMDDEAQVSAYAQADFSEPNGLFMRQLKTCVDPAGFDGVALDLGCGPGNISALFIEAFPLARLDAVDGSEAMLAYAANSIPAEWFERIRFILADLRTGSLDRNDYRLIFSNSLLHHLSEPDVLWQWIKRYASEGATVAIMDLLRPESVEQAQQCVERYAANEPEILRRDFYRSLLAAFSLEEIEAQLETAGLNCHVERVSDRHVFIRGVV